MILRYPGGKSKLAKFLLPIFPEFDEYREPFVGGGSVFFALKRKFPEKSYWINDLYTDLIQFYQRIADPANCLLIEKHLVSLLRYSIEEKKELFYKIKSGRKTYWKGVFEEFPHYFFFMNRCSFSGTTDAGGFSKHAAENRFTRSSIDRLNIGSYLLQRALITNHTYDELLESPSDGKTLIFCDPPYVMADSLYGHRGTLHKFDHAGLAYKLKHCQHTWFLTYDDTYETRDRYANFQIIPFAQVYGMGKTKLGDELLITNYRGEICPSSLPQRK